MSDVIQEVTDKVVAEQVYQAMDVLTAALNNAADAGLHVEVDVVDSTMHGDAVPRLAVTGRVERRAFIAPEVSAREDQDG